MEKQSDYARSILAHDIVVLYANHNSLQALLFASLRSLEVIFQLVKTFCHF